MYFTPQNALLLNLTMLLGTELSPDRLEEVTALPIPNLIKGEKNKKRVSKKKGKGKKGKEVNVLSSHSEFLRTLTIST